MLMKRLNLQPGQYKLLFYVMFLFLCQSLSAQPLHERKNGRFWFCSSCFLVYDTLEYKDFKLSVDYIGYFSPDWAKTYDEFHQQAYYRPSRMKKNVERFEFLNHEPEYMNLAVFIKELDGKFSAQPAPDTLYFKEGRAHTKKTYRFLDAKSGDVKDVTATVEFCVDFRNLERNSAQITFSTKSGDRKKAKQGMMMFLEEPDLKKKYADRHHFEL